MRISRGARKNVKRAKAPLSGRKCAKVSPSFDKMNFEQAHDFGSSFYQQTKLRETDMNYLLPMQPINSCLNNTNLF